MNIAIVDDEKMFIDKLKNIIIDKCNKNNVDYNIDCYSNGYDIIEDYKAYHLVFLDIEMPLIDGITVASKLNEMKIEKDTPYIAFVTGKDNLVFDALKTRPYLFIRKSEIEDDIDYCVSTVNDKLNKSSHKFTIHSGRNDFVIDVDDIVYLEKNKNYVIYHTKSHSYSVRNNLDDEFSKLEIYKFIRTHIGFAVNSKYISKIQSDSIMLTTAVVIPVGRNYRENVKTKFFEWLGEEYV